MRTIAYMKGGQVLTREVPDITPEQQAAIDARRVLRAKRDLQKQAKAERAALRDTAIDQLIRDGAVSDVLKTYAGELDAIIAADPKGDLPATELPAKPVELADAVVKP